MNDDLRRKNRLLLLGLGIFALLLTMVTLLWKVAITHQL